MTKSKREPVEIDEYTTADRIKDGITTFLYHCGLIILLTLAANLLVVTTGFLIGISINWSSLPLSFIIAVGVAVLFLGRDKLTPILIAAGAVLLFTLIGGLAVSGIYSEGYDGNGYHKMAVGLLANGWNPFHESSDAFARNLFAEDQLAVMYGSAVGDGAVSKAQWIDHFGKASWFFSASLYCILGNVECGKIYNLLGIISVIGIALPYLREKLDDRFAAPLVVTLLLAFGPVSIMQIFSFYVDGYLASMLFVLVIGLTEMLDKNSEYHGKMAWVVIFASMIVLGNTKFNGLAYGGLFCILFFLMAAVQGIRAKEPKPVLVSAGLFVAVVLVTACWAGAPTYVTNFLDHGTPIYPLQAEASADEVQSQAASGDDAGVGEASGVGAGAATDANAVASTGDNAAAASEASKDSAAATDETTAANGATASGETTNTSSSASSSSSASAAAPQSGDVAPNAIFAPGNLPRGFDNAPNWYKVFASLFCEMDNNFSSGDDPLDTLKIPFTINEREFNGLASPTYDLRIGGFGALFGGILILAVAALIANCILLWRRDERGLVVYSAILVAFIVVLMLAIDQSWWARYSPYFYLIPVLAIFLSFKLWDMVYGKIASLLMSVLLAINNGLFFMGVGTTIEQSALIDYQFNQLTGQKIDLYNPMGENAYIWGGLAFDLIDHGIDFDFVPADEVEDAYQMYYGRLMFGLPDAADAAE